MAILLAAQSPELQIEAITVVSGNVLVDQGVENALNLVELAGRTEIPVARGEKYPLRRKLITAPIVHGKNGLGETELPSPAKTAESRHAVDLIIDLVRAHPGQITLLPMGPLTNIARVLLKQPGIADQIPEIILMGGSIAGGNASPAAEANIYNDPEAAKIVFESVIPITMVGLGATHQTLLKRSHMAALADSRSPIARYVARIADFYIDFSESIGFDGGALHDPLAVGLAVDSSLAIESRPMHIAVETQGLLNLRRNGGQSLSAQGIRRGCGRPLRSHRDRANRTQYPGSDPDRRRPVPAIFHGPDLCTATGCRSEETSLRNRPGLLGFLSTV